MLKLAAGEISDSITNIFNDNLKSGCFPSEWNIIPVPKCCNPSSVSQFRPISVLPSVSKVFERLVYNQFDVYLQSNSNHNLASEHTT